MIAGMVKGLATICRLRGCGVTLGIGIRIRGMVWGSSLILMGHWLLKGCGLRINLLGVKDYSIFNICGVQNLTERLHNNTISRQEK